MQRKILVVLLIAIFLLAPAKSICQEDILQTSEETKGEEEKEVPIFNFISYARDSFFGQGWIWMWLILIVSMFGVSIIIERYITLREFARVSKDEIYRRVIEYLDKGDLKGALDYIKESKSPMATIAYAIIASIENGADKKTLERYVNEAYLTQNPIISERLSFLATIANISTLLGLLGTIVGLIMAFHAVSNVPAAFRTKALAIGIQVAMATTAFGLIIAIPTLAIHGYLTNIADKLSDELDDISTKFMNYFLKKKA